VDDLDAHLESRAVADTEDPVLAQLDAIGAGYEIVACDPDLADTAAFCEVYGYAPEDSANAILVVGKSEPPTYAMCLVLANHRLDVNNVVRKRLGTRKASFASAEATVELTGMQIGGVTPFGVSTDVPLWIDARVMDRERLIIGGGSRDRKLLVPPATLLAHPAAEVVEGLARDTA
jgi:prolyl-tRNA editing enzyme YbaK/EbsC (Cys-tRNA(Pro) deacylase)